ncbi:MAG TPA: response regulator [Candidatus Paceibacterota bacterium]
MSKKNILLIENTVVLGESIKKRLDEAGYLCLWEHDEKAGMAKLSEVRPDLILFDVVIPITSDNEVLVAINANNALSAVPIVVILDSDQLVEIERISKLGVKDYIIKTHFSSEELLEKVGNLIGPGEKGVSHESIHKTKAPEQTKILIIEDELMLSDMISTRFQQDKFQTFVANNGEVGLAMASDIHPDLILLDLIMPGLNGFEVLKKLKEKNSHLESIPVVVFSNLAQNREIAESHRLGAIDFLVKADFTPRQIVERTKNILAKYPQ